MVVYLLYKDRDATTIPMHPRHSLALLDTQHTQILRKDIRQRVQLHLCLKYRNNGKENESHYSILGLYIMGFYRDRGKENGKYRDYIGVIWGYIG